MYIEKLKILDAIAAALGGYLSGFDSIKSRHILPEDVHVKMFSVGNRIDPQEQFPVEIYAQASVKMKEESHIIAWQRELNGKGRRTTHGNAQTIIRYAKDLQDKIRQGNSSCVLPLIAYYGTGRLWLQKRNRIPDISRKELNRQKGYADCIAAESNEKQMMQWFEEMTYIQLQEGKTIDELEAVKKALRQCYLSADQSITDAQFYYNVKNHELEVSVIRETGEEKFPVRMLSDGEKGIISMVADIAYRMAMLNPGLLSHVLETPGIVLIDEIDLHLHPAWQKKIVQDLMDLFPNVQFIMTTHSANILVNVPRENIWILNHSRLFQPQSKTYGRTVEEILKEVMDVNVRPDDILNLQRQFDLAIDNADFEQANEILNQMKNIVGENAAEVIENQIVLDVETA